MYNEKLLRAAIAHEAYKGDTKTTEIICQTLYKMGLADSPEFSNSEAMCFEESDPAPEQIITVLNALGYELQQAA